MTSGEDRRVIVDTQFLIWAILKKASPGQEKRLETARQYLEALEEDKRELVVPAPVLAEILVGVEDADRKAATLRERFRIAPFDAAAASRFAEVYRATQNCDCGGKTKMKFDTMILAIALATKIRTILTFDGDLQRRAIEMKLSLFKAHGRFAF